MILERSGHSSEPLRPGDDFSIIDPDDRIMSVHYSLLTDQGQVRLYMPGQTWRDLGKPQHMTVEVN